MTYRAEFNADAGETVLVELPEPRRAAIACLPVNEGTLRWILDADVANGNTPRAIRLSPSAYEDLAFRYRIEREYRLGDVLHFNRIPVYPDPAVGLFDVVLE